MSLTLKIILLLITVSFVACSNDDAVQPVDTFDRTKMLESQLNLIIKPRLTTAKVSLDQLQIDVTAFLESPSVGTLQTARTQWIATYKNWIPVSFLDFGPGDGSFGTITENIGTFPVRVVSGTSAIGAVLKGIETFIEEGDYSLNNFNRDTRGFLGLEYLLFSGSEAEIVSKFTTEVNAENRKKYTSAVMQDITKRFNDLHSAWNGEYQSNFISSKGTDVGSSTSLLYNSFLKSYESLKNFKIGLPNGSRAGQTKTEPEKVEGYYSGMSIEFAKINFESIKNIYRGYDVDSTMAIGFTDYLQSISGGEALVKSTYEQINAVDVVFAQMNTTPNLAQRIQSNDPLVSNLFIELSKLTRYIKSDMSSLMGISITYSSGDGD
jgi:predicted lipoprotein